MKNPGLETLQIIDWGALDYGLAFERQRQLVSERIKDQIPDSLVLVEHPPTVTIGRSGSLNDLRVEAATLDRKGVSLHHVDRGGKATFHGPGQLVFYPIVKVEDKDIHLFLKQLLHAAADVLKGYGLSSEKRKGKPGLWVNNAKIASVGLSVQNQVTYHGLSLNVSTDPGWFDLIVPCGQKDERITSMDRETEAPLDKEDVKKRFVDRFCHHQGYRPGYSSGDFPGEKAKTIPGRHPRWLVKPASDPVRTDLMEKRLKRLDLATVCQSAHCPNLGECFERGTATFMILGTNCTRRCKFCAVHKAAPQPPDPGEPHRVAMAVKELDLTHAVITSVTRDDLRDGGAGHFSETIRFIGRHCPGVSVEVLVPDFCGQISAMDTVCAARPDVFNHNIETVPRLYAAIRPKAEYRRSLGVLSYASARGRYVKSGLMLGLGETEDEILQTIRDIKHAGCSMLTLGQYLAPSPNHQPVARYVTPEEFKMWEETARNMGFPSVASGALVRSSYRAGEMLDQNQSQTYCNGLKEAS